MTRLFFFLSPLALLAFWFAVPAARAGVPGDPVDYVCAAPDAVKLLRDDNPANGVIDPGEISPCANPTVDAANPAIVQDGVGGVRCLPETIATLRGTMTMIGDERASSDFDDSLTVRIEIREGEQVFVVSKIFEGAFGPWFSPIPEKSVFSIGSADTINFPEPMFGPLVLNGDYSGNLTSIGARLEEIAGPSNLNLIDPALVVPIIAAPESDLLRKNFDAPSGSATTCNGPCGAEEVDATNSDNASIAKYRVTIHFASIAPVSGQAACDTDPSSQ